MQTSKSDLEKRKAEIEKRRAEKCGEREHAVALRRLENEVKLGEIEEQTGKTIGIDLGVVWLRNGGMIVVRHPGQLAYEKYQISAGPLATAESMHTYAKAAVLSPDPKTEGAAYLDALEAEPGALLSVVRVANALCEGQQEVIRGKS